MATKKTAKTGGKKGKQAVAKKTAKRGNAKPKKAVVFKNVHAFVKAAMAKKLPRGTRVVLGEDVGFDVRVKGSDGPALLNKTDGAWDLLAQVMMALGVKHVSALT